jgi:methyl-accepting chemotaxis protein
MYRARIIRYSGVVATGLAIVLAQLPGVADEKSRTKDTDSAVPNDGPATTAANCARAEELTPQAKEVLAWTNDFGKEITQAIERWLASSELTPERLFSYLYYPIRNTDPTKFSTDYDGLADRDFQPILEKYIGKSSVVIYALATDRNGYAPTHNRQYSQPLTGNRAVDLVNNRTKRIFGDQIGFRAARNQKAYLLQSYARDTGELVSDISVPIVVRGRQWGCVRIGFRQVER